MVDRCIGDKCNDFSEIAKVSADVVMYHDTDLSHNTWYSYRVRHNEAGNSLFPTSIVPRHMDNSKRQLEDRG